MDGLRVDNDVRVVTSVERDVVCSCACVRDTNCVDAAHAAWARTIMPLHPHYHRDRRDIAKDTDEISTESEEGVGKDIISMNTHGEAEHLLDKRPKERVEIDWFLRAWDDSETQDVLEMGAYVRREIVVEKDERPCCLRATLERCETIR